MPHSLWHALLMRQPSDPGRPSCPALTGSVLPFLQEPVLFASPVKIPALPQLSLKPSHSLCDLQSPARSPPPKLCSGCVHAGPPHQEGLWGEICVPFHSHTALTESSTVLPTARRSQMPEKGKGGGGEKGGLGGRARGNAPTPQRRGLGSGRWEGRRQQGALGIPTMATA